MNFLAIPIIVITNAFITGVFTKLADISNDDGFRVSRKLNILFGFIWGIFGSLVVLGSPLVAAFYFGILFSWIHRYKLDNYSHGIGGSIILATIYFVHPTSNLEIAIAIGTFILFTLFGVLSRHRIWGKNIFTEYNIYSFVFLIFLSLLYPNVWLIVFASLANVIGYHIIKKWWVSKASLKKRD